jgi:hypothetical protein
MTRSEIEALVARERPGWRLVDFLEINAEAGPSIEVVIESGGRRMTLILDPARRIIGEQR